MKNLGLHQGVDDLQLLLAGVAGDVEVGQLVVDHLGALAVELVDDAEQMDFSLPGMAEAEMMIRSPGWISTCRWLEKAMRYRADIASPWLPVVMMTDLILRQGS